MESARSLANALEVVIDSSGSQKSLVFLVYFNYVEFCRPLTTKTIQHVSKANPHGTGRFKGPTALDKIARKSSPAMEISVSSKLLEDNHSTRFKC